MIKRSNSKDKKQDFSTTTTSPQMIIISRRSSNAGDHASPRRHSNSIESIGALEEKVESSPVEQSAPIPRRMSGSLTFFTYPIILQEPNWAVSGVNPPPSTSLDSSPRLITPRNKPKIPPNIQAIKDEEVFHLEEATPTLGIG